MPSYPTFDRNPLDLSDDAAAAGKPVGGVRRRAAQVRRARLRRRGPGRARQLPADPVDLAGQPARLLGQGQRVLPQAPARHRLLGARHRDTRGPAPGRREVARRGTRGEARPADDDRLPADQHHDLLRRRPPGRHLVREARPQHHRHAPVRALVQPGHRTAVADPHRLGRLADHRREVQRARRHPPRRPQGRRRRPAHARHPGRDGQPARRRPRLEEGRVRADPRRHDAQARRGRARLRRGRREDERARPAGRHPRRDHQGRHLRAEQAGRLPARQERRRARRRGRRPTVAEARRQRLRGDPGAVRDHQRAPGHPGLQDPREAHRRAGWPTWPRSTRASRSPSPTPRARPSR